MSHQVHSASDHCHIQSKRGGANKFIMSSRKENQTKPNRLDRYSNISMRFCWC